MDSNLIFTPCTGGYSVLEKEKGPFETSVKFFEFLGYQMMHTISSVN